MYYVLFRTSDSDCVNCREYATAGEAVAEARQLALSLAGERDSCPALVLAATDDFRLLMRAVVEEDGGVDFDYIVGYDDVYDSFFWGRPWDGVRMFTLAQALTEAREAAARGERAAVGVYDHIVCIFEGGEVEMYPAIPPPEDADFGFVAAAMGGRYIVCDNDYGGNESYLDAERAIQRAKELKYASVVAIQPRLDDWPAAEVIFDTNYERQVFMPNMEQYSFEGISVWIDGRQHSYGYASLSDAIKVASDYKNTCMIKIELFGRLLFTIYGGIVLY